MIKINDDFDVWEYVRQKRLDLVHLLDSRIVIFLDLNYWIRLRDSKTGNRASEYFCEILSISRRLVSQGVCVFPITDSIFYEVRKQSGSHLKDTFEMIDELSDGICIHNRSTRLDYEVLSFLQAHKEVDRYSAKEILWTKPYFLFINKLPFDTKFDKETEVKMQRLYADDMWASGFTDLLEQFRKVGMLEEFSGVDYGDISDQLNSSKRKYSHEYSSFHQLFMNEIAGGIDAAKNEIIGCYNYLYENETGNTVPSGEVESRWERQEYQKLIYHTFRLKRAGKYLPYINIMASCHAAIRWDKELKYDGNHQFDFEHAACALPYADVFFAERQLKHIITQKQLGLDQLYSCEVIAKAKEALAYLKGLV